MKTYEEIYKRSSTWELKNMVKALSSPISLFLNTEEDNHRLEVAKRELKRRQREGR